MTMMRQVELKNDNTLTIVWLDDIPGLHAGNYCTLKGDDREWYINQVFQTNIEKKEINRTWHVGGL